MRAELSSFIRDSVLERADWPHALYDATEAIDFDAVANDVLERMDELTLACSKEADPSLLIEERMNG